MSIPRCYVGQRSVNMLRQAFITLYDNNIIIITTSCLSNHDTIYKRVILIVSEEVKNTTQKFVHMTFGFWENQVWNLLSTCEFGWVWVDTHDGQ